MKIRDSVLPVLRPVGGDEEIESIADLLEVVGGVKDLK